MSDDGDTPISSEPTPTGSGAGDQPIPGEQTGPVSRGEVPGEATRPVSGGRIPVDAEGLRSLREGAEPGEQTTDLPLGED